jgi:type IV secretory pathway TraG/TraD family ATPase VirD4
MTVQDIAELDDDEIIVLHRNRKPIRAKRMDWRNFPELARLTAEVPGPLPILQEPEAIADLPANHPRSDEFGP